MCGWCYGFSPVITKIAQVFENDFNFVAVSGGMITGDSIRNIGEMADFILKAYPRVETTSGIQFGEAYLNLVKKGEFTVNSVKPAIAMSVFKSFFPFRSVEFAADIQKAHMFNGRDLNSREVYLEVIKKYDIDENEFIERVNHLKFREQTQQEFEEVKRIGINGFPAVVLQHDTNLYMVCNGYTSYDEVAKRLLVAEDNLK